MVQFKRLRLSGFKSFVDKTELEIGPGLNGIVGPNGCGKSNLVEALRWLMGESSAKRMRGGGMEDVIFAGTDKRSQRNIAEVSLLLDNSERKAPPAYNGLDEIEVIRRIERDHGSQYKINGKNARARDVQMLFADTVTGANSPALVSQGHVTKIINAKPGERRLILEESAGVSGLYARRHEAELRLRAADANLLRLEDLLSSLESRLSSLKRQSRQATRYKNLNAQIRQFEIMVAYLEWKALSEKSKNTYQQFTEIESTVGEKLATVTQLTKTQNTQVEELPALRKEEAEISAKLQHQKLALQRIEDAENLQSGQIKETREQAEQIAQDYQHEKQTFEENSKTLERIQTEEKELIELCKNEDTLLEQKAALKEQTSIALEEIEKNLTSLKESLAERRAKSSALQKRIQQNQDQITLLQSRKEKKESEISALEVGDESQKEISALETKIQELEAELENKTSKLGGFNQALEDAQLEIKSARTALSETESDFAEFTAEINTLDKILQSDKAADFVSVLDDISTDKGFEKALSRALGDSLMASLDHDAPSYWKKTDISDLAQLPQGAEPLLPHIKAPKELDATLSQIGFVKDAESGNNLFAKLKPGQALVSEEGDYWRWDGLHVKATAADRHSQHLEQKNRRLELESTRKEKESSLNTARENLEKALETEKSAKENLDTIQTEIRTIEKEINIAKPAFIRIKEKIAGIKKEKTRLTDSLANILEDIQNVEKNLTSDLQENKILTGEEDTDQDETLLSLSNQQRESREKYQDAVRDFDIFEQQKNTRRARMQALADERISLQNRVIRAREHLKTLEERKTSLNEKLSLLSKNPKNFENDKTEVLQKLENYEALRNAAAEKLASIEAEASQSSKALKEAELALGSARERRAHIQATYSALKEQLTSMEEDVQERFQMKPTELPNHTAEDLIEYEVSDIESLKKKKDKLTFERDAMGPVNLQADTESEDVEKEVTKMLHERNDLTQAIEELRGAIIKINKEARTRLLTAFEHVNQHFQSLFGRLFVGGKAHLELIDSDDPLNAGLEIFAQPPGKKLQSLSLLSGGEQTLTSIALIFAMFLTNPSPICVLDEIDAPLDDANVDRVCNLLDEISDRGETRFIVVTHHRLTMARMNRLYGVTMFEKGVSQLVSIDMQRSFEFTGQQVA